MIMKYRANRKPKPVPDMVCSSRHGGFRKKMGRSMYLPPRASISEVSSSQSARTEPI